MSDKSIAQKLLIKEGYRVALVNSPEGYATTIGELPPNVTLTEHPVGPADLLQVFVTSRRELETFLPGLKALLKPKGLLWVTYAKGTSRQKTDINRDIIRKYAPSLGLEAVALISIDETWSSMRLKFV